IDNDVRRQKGAGVAPPVLAAQLPEAPAIGASAPDRGDLLGRSGAEKTEPHQAPPPAPASAARSLRSLRIWCTRYSAPSTRSARLKGRVTKVVYVPAIITARRNSDSSIGPKIMPRTRGITGYPARFIHQPRMPKATAAKASNTELDRAKAPMI